jgi:hypothetical protein
MRVISTDLRLSSEAERAATEVSLARSRLARLGVDLPIVPGEASGEAAPGYRWRTRIAEFPVGDGGNAPVAPRPLAVSLTVWNVERGDAGVTLETLRLPPPERPDAPGGRR